MPTTADNIRKTISTKKFIINFSVVTSSITSDFSHSMLFHLFHPAHHWLSAITVLIITIINILEDPAAKFVFFDKRVKALVIDLMPISHNQGNNYSPWVRTSRHNIIIKDIGDNESKQQIKKSINNSEITN